jgi:alcohol dehydrogenase class IV
MMDTIPFRWQDGERVILFGRGALAQARELLGAGYILLTTERAAAQAPEVLTDAEAVHYVGPGRVDELADGLLAVAGGSMVALGGGRVIDVAKALAAARPPARVAAIPTTLSGAEMTAIHRHAAGLPVDTPRVRPAVVVNDPGLSASQSVPELAASALNAMGHAVEGPLTPLSNPVATLAGHEAARAIVAAFADAEPDRDALALGALLAGYVIGSTGYGLHHVLAQTLVRFAGIGHGPANAIMLPHSAGALRRRFPDAMEQLASVLGEDPEPASARLCELTGATGLRELGITEDQLDRCSDEAAERPELHLTPPAADRAELRGLYADAY